MNPTGHADQIASTPLPRGWAMACLKDIARINPPLDQRIDDDDRQVGFVPMAAVDADFGGVQRPQTRAFRDVKRGYTPFQLNDVIMAKITPCMENGKGGVVRGEPGTVFFGSTEFHVLRPRFGVMPEWIGCFLSQEQVRRAARLGMKGSAGQLRVPEEFLERLHLPLPPTAEQQRITDRVDELFTDLAAGVAALERVKRNLSRYRAAVLHAAVTGRLTEAWRKQHGPPEESGSKLLERILAERRRQWERRTLARYEKDGKQPPKNWRDRFVQPRPPKLNVEGTESVLPTLPESWCWASLDQVSDVTGGVAKNQKEAGGVGMREVPYLRVANVQRGYLDLSEIKTISATEADIEELTLQPGDVLFTEGGDRDKLGRGWVWDGQIAECIHQNHIFRARPYLSELQSVLLSHAGNSYGQIWFRSNGIQSVNLASISLGVLRQFPMPIAPLAEQAAVVEAVNEKLSQIDALEVEVDHGLARAGRLRQAILKAAFEGRLVPQDPGDEPASALLARIRATAASEVAMRARNNGPTSKKRGRLSSSTTSGRSKRATARARTARR